MSLTIRKLGAINLILIAKAAVDKTDREVSDSKFQAYVVIYVQSVVQSVAPSSNFFNIDILWVQGLISPFISNTVHNLTSPDFPNMNVVITNPLLRISSALYIHRTFLGNKYYLHDS